MSDLSRVQRIGLGLLGLIGGVVIWWLLVSQLAPTGTLLARFGPRDAFISLGEFVTSVRGRQHAYVTVARLLYGLSLSAIVGVGIGVLLGLSKRSHATLSWLFQFLRMVSPLAWTPIAIAVFGIGDPPVRVLVIAAAIWPVILATAAGVAEVDQGWVQVARTLGANRWEVIRRVYLPAIRGHVGTGIRLALGTGWIVIVPAEMLGVDSGLGYAILDARDRLDYSELMAIVVLIGGVGTLLDALVRRVTRPRLAVKRPVRLAIGKRFRSSSLVS